MNGAISGVLAMLRHPLHWTAGCVLLASAGTAIAFDSVPAVGDCRQDKRIEQALGSFAYRVVVSGGYRAQGEDRPVKVQIWSNDDRDWVITEAFLKQKRTCVVRAGVGLHMLY